MTDAAHKTTKKSVPNRLVRTAICATYALSIASADGFAQSVDDFEIHCEHIETVLPPSLKLSAAALAAYDKAKGIAFVDGVLTYRYEGARGIQMSPWLISAYALRHLENFCKDGDVKRLPPIKAQREWLKMNLVARRSGNTDFLVIPYDFPNLPYASKPGWASSLAQVSTLSLFARFRPKEEIAAGDQTTEKIAAAFAVPATEGGLYSDYKRSTIWWEEVATPERPSMVINGGAIALYLLAADLPTLPISEALRQDLAVKVEKAKRALLIMMPDLVTADGRLLYDLSGTNFRDRGHYSHVVLGEVFSWLQRDGYVSVDELNRVIDLKR